LVENKKVKNQYLGAVFEKLKEEEKGKPEGG